MMASKHTWYLTATKTIRLIWDGFDDDDNDDDDDDDRFNTALFSSLKHTHCTFVAWVSK